MFALLQVIIAGLVTGCLYGLLALGIVLVYRTTGVLNFAYGAMAAIYACCMYVLLTGLHFNFWLACIAVLVFALVLGIALERGFARPVLHTPIFTKAIATLALALVLETIAQLLWPQLTSPQRFPTPFESYAFHAGSIYLSLTDIGVIVITMLVMIGLHFFLTRTKLGIAMRATADGLQTARLMGFLLGWSFL